MSEIVSALPLPPCSPVPRPLANPSVLPPDFNLPPSSWDEKANALKKVMKMQNRKQRAGTQSRYNYTDSEAHLLASSAPDRAAFFPDYGYADTEATGDDKLHPMDLNLQDEEGDDEMECQFRLEIDGCGGEEFTLDSQAAAARGVSTASGGDASEEGGDGGGPSGLLPLSEGDGGQGTNLQCPSSASRWAETAASVGDRSGPLGPLSAQQGLSVGSHPGQTGLGGGPRGSGSGSAPQGGFCGSPLLNSCLREVSKRLEWPDEDVDEGDGFALNPRGQSGLSIEDDDADVDLVMTSEGR
uniref:Uncharacterized protein n=1 Tax=Chromera velia CCMP2878 TaxID=1169474 RepID=A0A0G4HG84_9ALVE|eukprot:Cvel_27162.t1-p1 / transcript=Cvel_27162.t1 / gene=Cvel_27162 / organism=Chromera_velia_CCMP2878 / gene_product=hypothetical protein / transcript_product=hypothetical protein / location=Cvel_scaffold3345:9827-11301(-) / protein_length=297 / sequence_SO=supercontig / SO=protein_coding / is_pseudo=false